MLKDKFFLPILAVAFLLLSGLVLTTFFLKNNSFSLEKLGFRSEENSQNSINKSFAKTVDFENRSLSQNPKPWLMADKFHLLDQNNQLIIPQAKHEPQKGFYNYNAFYNLKPIQVGQILYFPYAAGKIAIIDLEKETVAWSTLDFQIADMDIFNGKFYLTEYNEEQCNRFAKKTCSLWEVNPENGQKRAIFSSMTAGQYGGIDPSLDFADEDYFWLVGNGTDCIDGACRTICSSGERAKYDLQTGEFVEAFVVGLDCRLYRTDKLEKNYSGKMTPYFGSVENNNFVYKAEIVAQDKECSSNLYFAKDGSVTPEVEEKCRNTDENLEKILVEKTFPFDLEKFGQEMGKEKDSCGNFSYKKGKKPENETNFSLGYGQEQVFFENQPIKEEWKNAWQNWVCLS